MFMLRTLIIILLIASGYYSSVVAGEKGYSRTNWFLGGLFFGGIALLAAVGLPNKKLDRYIRRMGLKQGAFTENEFNEISRNEENENNILVPITYDSEEIWSFLLSKTNNKLDQADRSNSKINKNKIVFKSGDEKIIANAKRIFSNSGKFDRWIIKYNFTD